MNKTQVIDCSKIWNNEKMKEELKNQSYTIISGKEVIKQSEISEEELEDFTNSWNNLELDPYMPDGGKYRLRRLGYLTYDLETKALKIGNRNDPFLQSSDINSFVGNVERVFSPALSEFLNSSLLKWLISSIVSNLPIKKENVKVKINVHQIRILSFSDSMGLPTPEGIHRDGHTFVSQHLIARSNIVGGTSGIYTLNEEPVVHTQLFNLLDSIVLLDENLKHDVSPIYSFSGREGYRDMLIIDYNL